MNLDHIDNEFAGNRMEIVAEVHDTPEELQQPDETIQLHSFQPKEQGSKMQTKSLKWREISQAKKRIQIVE